MAERCIPVGCVRATESRPNQWHRVEFCPVCERALTLWLAGSAYAGVSCEGCALYERGLKCWRIGFEWQKTSRNLYAPESPILTETTRLHTDSRWRAFTLTSAMEWLVLADWLDENDFPLNAAGIRANFTNPFEEYK